MKKKIAFIILSILVVSFSKKNDEKIFTSKKISIRMYKDYLNPNSKILHEKVIGKNVIITIDTIFNSYSFIYTNQDNKKEGIKLNYVRDLFDNLNLASPLINRLYVMKDNTDNYYELNDYIGLYKSLAFKWVNPNTKADTLDMVYYMEAISPKN